MRLTSGVLGGSYEQNPLAASGSPTSSTWAWAATMRISRIRRFDATLAGVTTQVATPEVGRTFGSAQLNGTSLMTSRIYSHFGVSGEKRSGKSEDLGASLGVRVVFQSIGV